MLDSLHAHPSLVIRVTCYEHFLRGSVEQLQAVAELVDGTRLHCNEVWIGGELRKYAYYWLTLTGELIGGWDNAPHHPHISTYPHHFHAADSVSASTVRSLGDALNELHGLVRQP